MKCFNEDIVPLLLTVILTFLVNSLKYSFYPYLTVPDKHLPEK